MVGRPDEAERDVLDVDEVARYLGVAPVSVYRWCREGRLPAVKLGRVWRVRRAALDDLLRRTERPRTLAGQLSAFLEVPDHVIAVAGNVALLRRLDAAFFQVAEARGGVLVKFYAGESASATTLRDDFARHGLDARELEAAGRLRLIAAPPQRGARGVALRAAQQAEGGLGRTLWASFDWVHTVGLDEALREQEELEELVDAQQMVLKTAVLQEVADAWTPQMQRRAQQAHRGMLWLSPARLWLSRGHPLPPD